MFPVPHPTIRDPNRRELNAPANRTPVRDVVDPRSFAATVAPREHADADVGQLAFGEAGGGGRGELREDPDAGIRVGLEGVAALDWLGIGRDRSIDVNAALLGDGENVVYGNWGGGNSNTERAASEESSEEESFGEHFEI